MVRQQMQLLHDQHELTPIFQSGDNGPICRWLVPTCTTKHHFILTSTKQLAFSDVHQTVTCFLCLTCPTTTGWIYRQVHWAYSTIVQFTTPCILPAPWCETDLSMINYHGLRYLWYIPLDNPIPRRLPPGCLVYMNIKWNTPFPPHTSQHYWKPLFVGQRANMAWSRPLEYQKP